MGWIVGLTRIVQFFGVIGAAYELKNTSDWSVTNRDWNVKDNFCRLLAHTSIYYTLYYNASFLVVTLTARHRKLRYTYWQRNHCY